MKIYLSGIFSEDSFADNVHHTLKCMDYSVFVSQEAGNSQFFNSSRLWSVERIIKPNSIYQFEKTILKQVRAFKPDLFFSLTQQYSPSFLEELASLVKTRIIWWGDPLAEDKRLTLLSQHWSAIFLKDLNGVNKLKIVGCPAFLLDEAMNPDWHKPLAPQSSNSIIVAGNFYNFRQVLCQTLIEHGYQLDLYGPKYPRWSLPTIKKYHSGKYIVKEDKSRIFGSGLACLNSFNFYEGDSLNCRAFEIAGAAGLQLIEYRPAISRCFEPGTELLTFSTKDELIGLIERAQKNPSQMLKIREAGAKRALSHHTYQHRLTDIFKTIGV
ncbi:MAG: glycosyltransferase [Deltaproteobacteria bacterium]